MAEEAGNSGPSREAEGGEEVAETPAEEQEAAATAEQQPPRRGPGRGGLWLALVALVVALGAGGAGAYGFWYFQNRFGEVAERLSAAEQERQAGQEAMAELRDELKAVRGELQSFQGEKEGLAERLNGLEDRLSTLRQATEELNARLEGGPTYWRLERVESLLLAADRVARLEEDARAAHSALAEADRMLRDLNDPAWLDVREAIQNAMTRLEQVPNVDVPGVAFRLASLSEAALELPLERQEAPSLEPQTETGAPQDAAPEGVWDRIKSALGNFWSDIKGLVRLRRSGKEAEPLLPPDRAAFLRHNLVLNLQAARLALLRDNPEVYRQSLGSARDWVERFFDGDSDEVAGMLSAIEELESRQVAADLPKLEEPLRKLRQLRKEQQD